MQFSYRGFEQHDGIRKFKFAGVVERQPQSEFCFSVDLKLLVAHSVSLQETPALCVQVLTRTHSEGTLDLSTCIDYVLSESDMLAFTAPRRALALAHKNKKPMRVNRPKPTQASQLFGTPSAVFNG